MADPTVEKRKAVLKARLDNDHVYHSPKPGQAETYQEIRNLAKNLALFMVEKCPDGRELSSALTKIEEAVFHANAAIARHG